MTKYLSYTIKDKGSKGKKIIKKFFNIPYDIKIIKQDKVEHKHCFSLFKTIKSNDQTKYYVLGICCLIKYNKIESSTPPHAGFLIMKSN